MYGSKVSAVDLVFHVRTGDVKIQASNKGIASNKNSGAPGYFIWANVHISTMPHSNKVVRTFQLKIEEYRDDSAKM